MAGETVITIIGNLTADPELAFTQGSGDAVSNFTVASTPRTFDRQSNEWKDGETLFMRCAAWRELGTNVAESLTKGMRVIVTGVLKSRKFQTKEGENRTVIELEVHEVGPSLKYATAQVTRVANGNAPGGQQGGGGFGGQQGGQQGGGTWGGQQAGAQQGGTWGGQQTAQQGAQGGNWGSQQGGQGGVQAPAQQGNDPWATPAPAQQVTQPPAQQGGYQQGQQGDANWNQSAAQQAVTRAAQGAQQGQPQGQTGGQHNAPYGEPPF